MTAVTSGRAVIRSLIFINLLYFLPSLHRQQSINKELNVFGSFWLNRESLTTSSVFLCEFLVLDAKLNRRHIVFTDSKLPR